MFETMTPVHTGRGKTTPAVLALPAEGLGDLRPLALTLELQSLTALLTVLTTVARLGCRITQVNAAERHAVLGVLAPQRVAHRLLPCLGELIEVLAVSEVPYPQHSNEG